MSDEAEDGFSLSEPAIIRTAFVSGVKVEHTDGHIRVLGWEAIPEMRERRLTARNVYTRGAAESLWAQLGDILGKRKGH